MTTVMPTVSRRARRRVACTRSRSPGPLATGVDRHGRGGVRGATGSGPAAPLLARRRPCSRRVILVAGAAPTMRVLVRGPARAGPRRRRDDRRRSTWSWPGSTRPCCTRASSPGSPRPGCSRRWSARPRPVRWRSTSGGGGFSSASRVLVVPDVARAPVPALRRIGPPETPAEAAGAAGRLAWAGARRGGRARAQPRRAACRLPWSVGAVAGGRPGVLPSCARAPGCVPGRDAARWPAGCRRVIVTRGLVAGAFFGAEVYLPYLLTERYAFSPTTAGIALTFAGMAWAGTSWLQGRLGERLPHRSGRASVGSLLVRRGVVGVLMHRGRRTSPAAVAITYLDPRGRRDGPGVLAADRARARLLDPRAARASTARPCRSRTRSARPSRSRSPGWRSPPSPRSDAVHRPRSRSPPSFAFGGRAGRPRACGVRTPSGGGSTDDAAAKRAAQLSERRHPGGSAHHLARGRRAPGRSV